jgi:hypothetical protein
MARPAPSQRAKAARARRAAAALRLPRVEVLAINSAMAHVRLNDLEVVSEANARDFRMVVAERKAEQRKRVRAAFDELRAAARAWPCAPPRGVLFVRLGVGTLDDDNLANAFKAVRDEVAKQFRVTDAPGGPVAWRYAQRPHDVLGCELFIEW